MASSRIDSRDSGRACVPWIRFVSSRRRLDEPYSFWYTCHTLSARESRLSRKGLILAWALLVMAALSISIGGCHLRPLLYDVSVSPGLISPNADGDDDATSIEYKLSRNAALSIYFENAQGEKFYFRKDRPRSAGDYRVLWGGAINQSY